MLLLTRIMAFINRWWDFHLPWKSYEDFSLVRKAPVKNNIYIFLSVPSCSYIYIYIQGCALCRRPHSSPQLQFWRLGASIFEPWGPFTPREHPGGPFWHPRATLEDHGSSRTDTRLSGTGFSYILEWFRDLIFTAFWRQRLGFVSRSFFF